MGSLPQTDPQASQTTTTTPDGKWLVTTTTTFTAVPTPETPTLVIPSNAKTSGILDNVTWKAEKDGGTPGTVSSTFNKYIGVNDGRQFNMVQSGHAGMRWSVNWAKNETVKNFVYDLYYKAEDPSQIGQLELDMNQSMSDGRNFFLCIQANFKSGVWDYTLTPQGACHWYHSNIKINPADWKAGVWNHIRLKTSRDDAGVVTYEGVELNGKYSLFDPSCKGVSAIKLNWTPGSLINNYQTNGANASGTINTYAKQLQILYW